MRSCSTGTTRGGGFMLHVHEGEDGGEGPADEVTEGRGSRRRRDEAAPDAVTRVRDGADLAVLHRSERGSGLLAGFYAILWIAKFWFSSAIPEVEIYRSPAHLPLYAFYSVVRIFVAYALSLVFAIAYGYTAAYNKRLESLLIATLDILQSIPVLSFLPGVMLAMMSLFPFPPAGHRIRCDSADSSPAKCGTWPSASTPR